MIRLNKEVFIEPKEVASIEEYGEYYRDPISGGSTYIGEGARIYLRSGEKVYVKGMSADEVYKKIAKARKSEGVG